MSDLQKLQDAFIKADALAQQGDEQARRDAKMFADEIRRVQAAGGRANSKPQEGFMGQLNRGISDSVGGVVDFVNPFDNPVWQGTPVGMGSAQDALTGGMRAIGARVADNPPETITGAVGRGAGQAAGALPTVAGGLALAGRIPGAVGQAAQSAYQTMFPASVGRASIEAAAKPGASAALRAGDMARGMASFSAPFAAEVGAGALSEGGAEITQQAGGGELAQNLARVAAPLSIPAGAAALRRTASAAENLPLAGYLARTGRQLARSIAPMTETGAREVAREELLRRTGSPDRMRELGQSIDPQDPYSRTPAQQTGDPELLGLEDAAKARDPILREELNAQTARSRDTMVDDLRQPGSVRDTRAFFDERLTSLKDGMDQRITRAMAGARADIEAAGSTASEANLSTRVVSKLKMALDDELEQERALWAAVPKSAPVPTSTAKAVAQRLVEETPRAQQKDIPPIVRRLLLEEGGFGEGESAAELHGLYSELRRVARSAMAGNDQNKNAARIANEVAEAILRDLGAVDAETEVGRAINEARAFSRALHEKFDQGAVGRILKRTIDGDETMTPETALRKTVGVSGPEGAASVAKIEGATRTASQDVQEYLRSQFLTRSTDADGNISRKRAATWLRENSDLLSKYPGLRGEFSKALANQRNAEEYTASVALRNKIIDQSPVAAFNKGYADQAADSILRADDPTQAARSVARAAKQDTSGKALAGVKAALSDKLIGEATNADGVLTGKGMQAVLRNTRMQAALRQVYSADELKRLERIADAVAKMDVAPSGTGEVIDAPVNQLLLRIVQVAAAQQGGSLGASGNMGGSLQTANIFQRTATRALENLTNKRAREILMDAVKDPELMRALMLNETAQMPTWARSKLAPYLAGATAAVAAEE